MPHYVNPYIVRIHTIQIQKQNKQAQMPQRNKKDKKNKKEVNDFFTKSDQMKT